MVIECALEYSGVPACDQNQEAPANGADTGTPPQGPAIAREYL